MNNRAVYTTKNPSSITLSSTLTASLGQDHNAHQRNMLALSQGRWETQPLVTLLGNTTQ